MLSEPCIDSLIIHELAHAKEQYHNQDFLGEILKIMPDYFEVDETAHEAVEKLFWEGWCSGRRAAKIPSKSMKT